MKTKILNKNYDPVNGIITVKAQSLSDEYTCWCKAKDYTFEFKEGISKKETNNSQRVLNKISKHVKYVSVYN